MLEVVTVTIEDVKKIDKRIRQIQDPFGTGFPTLRSIGEEWSRESGLPIYELVQQYVAWKWKK